MKALICDICYLNNLFKQSVYKISFKKSGVKIDVCKEHEHFADECKTGLHLLEKIQILEDSLKFKPECSPSEAAAETLKRMMTK